MNRQDIYTLIDLERLAQHRKWDGEHGWGAGDCSSDMTPPIVKAVVLGEECGEVQRAVLEKDSDNLRTELIQVAAVAVAWLEAL
jgi:hypothetical protein